MSVALRGNGPRPPSSGAGLALGHSIQACVVATPKNNKVERLPIPNVPIAVKVNRGDRENLHFASISWVGQSKSTLRRHSTSPDNFPVSRR